MSTLPNNASSQSVTPSAKTSENTHQVSISQNVPESDLKLLEQLFNQNHFAAVEIRAKQLIDSYPDAWSLYNILGLAQDRLEKYEDSIQSYKSLLKQEPNNLEACMNLGLVYLKLDDVKSSEICFHKVLALKPESPNVYKNLAILYNNADRYDDAIKACQQALALQPSGQETYNIMGSAYSNLKQYEEAIECFKRALTLHPQMPVLHYRLAVALSNLRKFEEALLHYQKVLAINPNFADAYTNSGLALTNLGKHEEALACYQAAAHLKKEDAELHFYLGNACHKLKRSEQAIEALKKAISLNPKLERAYINLSFIYKELGQNEQSIASLQYLLAVNPLHEEALLIWSENLRTMKITNTGADFRGLLLRSFENPAIDSSSISPSSLGLLCNDLTAYIKKSSLTLEDIDKMDPATSGLLSIHLKNSVICDLEIERLLCQVRRLLLQAFDREGEAVLSLQERRALVEAFAFQADLNEYLWPRSEEEEGLVTKLLENIKADLKKGQDPDPLMIFLLSAYDPLRKVEDLCAWAMTSFDQQSESLKALLKKTIIDAITEEKLYQDIEPLTSIENKISLAVQEQYEENPYPRWDTISRYKGHKLFEQVRNEIKPNHIDLGHEPEAPQVLIAGCGTGKQPLVSALHYKTAEILAVDLSKASLAYAMRKAQELQIQNIRFGQADILKLSELQRTFDMIECCGVLHHMADPEAGLKNLLTCLKPKGLLKIALYSETARKDIVAMREAAQSDQIRDFSIQGLRQFRSQLYEKCPDTFAKLQTFRDFFSASELRDMMLHVQEHRYTIPQLQTLLHNNGLEFLGFIFRDLSVKQTYLKHFQHDPATLNLDHWHTFEQTYPSTFLSMYQFWCRKKE